MASDVYQPWLYRQWLASAGARSHGWGAWLRAGPVGQLLVGAGLGLALSPVVGAVWLTLNALLYTVSFGALAAVAHTGRDQGGRIGRARDVRWLGAVSGGEYLHLSHHVDPDRWSFSDGLSYRDPGGLVIAGLIRWNLATASSTTPAPRQSLGEPVRSLTESASKELGEEVGARQ